MFIDCTAETGGAIYTDSNVTVLNSKFTGCSCVSDSWDAEGGAIYIDDYGFITNCTFINCSTTSPNEWSGGGAIYVDSSYLSVLNSTFINNTGSLGGAIYLYFADDEYEGVRSNQVIGSTFINNSALRGGAIFE